MKLVPTADQTYTIVGGNIQSQLNRAESLVKEGKIEQACSIRYSTAQQIADLLIKEDNVDLDFTDANTIAAADILHESAIDNFLIGEYELSAAQLELLLDCDAEDHTGATEQLALCYIAIGDWDCLAEILPDIETKTALYALVYWWIGYAKEGKGDIRLLLKHTYFVDQLKAAEHTTDEEFLKDITSPKPSQTSIAKQLYLKIEPLFNIYPKAKIDLLNVLK